VPDGDRPGDAPLVIARRGAVGGPTIEPIERSKSCIASTSVRPRATIIRGAAAVRIDSAFPRGECVRRARLKSRHQTERDSTLAGEERASQVAGGVRPRGGRAVDVDDGLGRSARDGFVGHRPSLVSLRLRFDGTFG
jgi:hypothetical protein